MFRFAVKLAFAAGALWAVWTFVPVGGKTLSARWAAAGDLAGFLERGWAEAREAIASPAVPARPAPRDRAGAPRERPAEKLTEQDRKDLDRLVAERLAGG